jgi:branched-chain amino acid transport system ATP-binding protein
MNQTIDETRGRDTVVSPASPPTIPELITTENPPAAEEPIVRLVDLSVGYADVAVVRHLNLHVNSGEVVALLGPNGAGKTSTLRAISGLNRVLDGSIELFGRDCSTRSAHDRHRGGLAHVPEGRGIFYSLSVRDNLRLNRNSGGNFDAVLEYFPELRRLLDRRAGLLSGGEQQMLAIGRSLLGRPRLLLVDEMSLGLAPILVERLLPVMRDIADDTGCGVLLVEQHVDMALEIADRAYVLAHGECVLDDTAQTIRADRQNLELRYMGHQA